HLGCLYKYEPTTERFECPCHGSKFWLDGTKILEEGPAPRSLDRFIFELRDDAGNLVTQMPENGDPLPLPDNAGSLRMIVKTGKRILGGPPKSIRE
ncbi:MAG: ubiquinol-cytochrome c reductase iron-sulfur subunit, partial [Anaerolineae bacterium]